MKKIKIAGVILGFVCLVVLVCKIVGTLFFDSSLKYQVDLNCQQYKEAWMLSSVEVNDEKKEIVIELKNRGGKEPKFDETPHVVDEISSFLFSDNYQYSENDYIITIKLVAGEPISVFIEVGNITPQMNEIKLTSFRLSDVSTLGLREFAEWYPNAVYIKTDLHANNLDDLEKFHQLKEIFFTKGINEKQRDTILTLFPDIDLGDTEIVMNSE